MIDVALAQRVVHFFLDLPLDDAEFRITQVVEAGTADHFDNGLLHAPFVGLGRCVLEFVFDVSRDDGHNLKRDVNNSGAGPTIRNIEISDRDFDGVDVRID